MTLLLSFDGDGCTDNVGGGGYVKQKIFAWERGHERRWCGEESFEIVKGDLSLLCPLEPILLFQEFEELGASFP